MFCEEFTDLIPYAGSMISCPDLLEVEEMDGIITITCYRSSALPFQSVYSQCYI